MSRDRYNSEHYPDPTAYEAIKHMQAEELSLKTYRPMVYICSPYSGDVETNVTAARRYCRFAVAIGYIPIAPHLFFTQFLNDADSFERKLGMRFGHILMDRCAEVWVFGSRISSGMNEEIKRAKRKGYTLRYFSADLKEGRPCQ
jgi:hypothetical protein